MYRAHPPHTTAASTAVLFRLLPWAVLVVASFVGVAQAHGMCLEQPVCPGDCDGDGRVRVAELLRGVGIALGHSGREECLAFDADLDDRVSIAELLAAVDAALWECSPEPVGMTFSVGWLVFEDAPDLVVPGTHPEANIFTVTRRRTYPKAPPLRRGPGLAGTIVVVGLNEGGEEVARTWELDPRWVHFDYRDRPPETFLRSEAGFSAHFFYEPGITTLEFYLSLGHFGDELRLRRLGSTAVCTP